jgi:hypothetical protein
MDKTLVQTHSSVFLFLPVELWNAIFRHVERRNLATLARVSRLFQREAEYVLYYLVTLDTDAARLASWCVSILDERRRAFRVHTLRLPGHFKPPPWDLAYSSAEIQRLLTQAFEAVVNLKELYILKLHVEGPIVPTISRSTVENCTFRLTGMACDTTGMTADEMWEFLHTQPDISHWFPSFLRSINAIPPNILPSIRELVLSLPEKLPLLYGRPIQKLMLVCGRGIEHVRHDGLAVIHSLRQFEGTLRVLEYMVHGSLADWTATDVIRSLAKDVPNLEELTLLIRDTQFRVSFRDLPRRFPDNAPLYQVSTDEQKDLFGAISGFKHLHHLFMHFHMAALHEPNTEPPEPSNPLEHEPEWTPDSPAQSRKVASMFMASCPSLRQIVLQLRTGISDGRRQLRKLCYVRSRDGGPGKEAWLEGFEDILFMRWWMKSVIHLGPTRAH